jgi:hypothetical protein
MNANGLSECAPKFNPRANKNRPILPGGFFIS